MHNPPAACVFTLPVSDKTHKTLSSSHIWVTHVCASLHRSCAQGGHARSLVKNICLRCCTIRHILPNQFWAPTLRTSIQHRRVFLADKHRAAALQYHRVMSDFRAQVTCQSVYEARLHIRKRATASCLLQHVPPVQRFHSTVLQKEQAQMRRSFLHSACRQRQAGRKAQIHVGVSVSNAS